jgi:hypothetical protein
MKGYGFVRGVLCALLGLTLWSAAQAAPSS